jgi:hypothetical protein
MSRRHRIAAFCALLVLAGSAGCAGPGGAGEGDTAALHFGWPVGLTAFVETERSTRTSGSRGPHSTTVRMSYRIDVEEAEGGRLIRRGEIRAEDPASGRIYPLHELPEPLASQLMAVFPSFVVSNEGRIVRLDGIEPLLEEAQRKLEKRLAELPPESEEAKVLAATQVSEENLLEAAREHWQKLAGAWAGTSLAVGEIYQRKEHLAVPALGGLRILSTTEFGIGQRIPCGEEMAEAGCVEIEVRSLPLPEALIQLEEALRERARDAGADGRGALEDFEIEESSYLVTEPSTLVPHYLETTTTFRATLRRSGKADIAVEDMDQTVYRYQYSRPSGETIAP